MQGMSWLAENRLASQESVLHAVSKFFSYTSKILKDLEISLSIEGLLSCVTKTNLMHYLSSVYFFNQPLHVSGIFIAHHLEVYCIYTTISTWCTFHLTACGTDSQNEKHNTYQLYIYSKPPDDGLQICPKHVEVVWRNKLRINSASSGFLLHRCIETHGQQNIKNY
jgi:hypothetical protein